MNELKTRNTFSVATQSFMRLGDHQASCHHSKIKFISSHRRVISYIYIYIEVLS